MGNNQFALKPQTPPRTNRTIAKTVTSVLREPGLGMINFRFGNLTVKGPNFMRVAAAVDSGQIKCWTVNEFKSQGKDELAPGMMVNARYEITPNAMVFSSEDFGTNPGEDRTIVHEAVHAAFDLDAPLGKKSEALSIDDEAAAVIAVAFYIRLCNKPVGGFLMDAVGPEKPALNLIDGLIAKNGPVQTWVGQYVFGPDESQPIREGAAAKWHFDKFIDKDGREADNSGAKYVYDGVPVCGKKGCK